MGDIYPAFNSHHKITCYYVSFWGSHIDISTKQDTETYIEDTTCILEASVSNLDLTNIMSGMFLIIAIQFAMLVPARYCSQVCTSITPSSLHYMHGTIMNGVCGFRVITQTKYP